MSAWPVVPLGEVAETALGKMLDRGKPRGHAKVPYLRNVNVQWGRIDTHDLLEMELADEERERFGVRAGDLLMCEGGEIGRCAIWSGRAEYLAYQKALHRVRTGDRLDARYLRYLMQHYAETGVLAALATGSTIAHLPQQQLRRVPVPLPEVDEQRRIVDLLEDHLSRLDAGREGLELVARRLDALVHLALDRSRSGETQPLEQVAEIQGGIQKQPRRAPRENAFPFLRVANVRADGLDLADVHSIELFDGELDRLRLVVGDLLVVEGNGSASQIGRAALWDGSIQDCVHQNHLIRVRGRSHVVPEYLEAVWNSPTHRRALTEVASSSSGLHTLSVSKLKRLSLPVPTVEEQHQRVAELARVRAAKSRLANAVIAARTRQTLLGRALLTAAFSGRLTGAASDIDRAEELVDA